MNNTFSNELTTNPVILVDLNAPNDDIAMEKPLTLESIDLTIILNSAFEDSDSLTQFNNGKKTTKTKEHYIF